jgi:hypothetical protein
MKLLQILQRIFLSILLFNSVIFFYLFSMEKKDEPTCSSTSPVSPSNLSNKYSINLIWTNKHLNENQRYVYPLIKAELNKDETNLEKYKALLTEYKIILEKKCLDKYEQKIKFYWTGLNATYSYPYSQYLNINKFNGDAYDTKESLDTNGFSQNNLKKYKQALDSFYMEINKCKIYCEDKSNLDKNKIIIEQAKDITDKYKVTLDKNSLITFKENLENYKKTLKENASFELIIGPEFDSIETSAFDKAQIDSNLNKLNSNQDNLEKYKNALELLKSALDNCTANYLIDFEKKKINSEKNKFLSEETKTNLEIYKTEIEEYIANLGHIDLNKTNLSKIDLDQYKNYLIETDLYKNFLNYIFRWADASQGNIVNLWYDSVLTPKQAIENTRKLFDDYAKEHKKSAPIKLKDIREISYVKKNPEAFFTEIPVYFRVDLLRPIIALNIVAQNEYFVYADLDMEPLTQEQLFDTETLQNLHKYGIVMAYDDVYEFENGFQIIGNENKNLINAMEFALIGRNMQRAKNGFQDEIKCLDKILYKDTEGLDEEKTKNFMLAQLVYSSYRFMFQYFYVLEGYGNIEFFCGNNEKDKYGYNSLFLCNKTATLYTDKKKFYRIYDKEKDGFDNSCNTSNTSCFISNNAQIIKTTRQHAFDSENFNHTFTDTFTLWVPTKKVKLPPSELKFN